MQNTLEEVVLNLGPADVDNGGTLERIAEEVNMRRCASSSNAWRASSKCIRNPRLPNYGSLHGLRQSRKLNIVCLCDPSEA
jgi:hypothetical protein